MAYIGNPVQQSLTKVTSQSFNGTGSQTVFTLNRAVNTGEELEVFVENVQQEPGVGKSYTATGTTLTFDAAPQSGTGNIYVIYRGIAEVTRRLEHDPNQALAATTGTFSGNVDVTGTVTADVTRTSGANTNAFVLSDNVTGAQTSGFGTRIIGQSNSGSAISAIGLEADGGTNNDTAISFYTQPSAGSLRRRMKLGLSGDISFYEDTGTTAKLFWDASAENLGIGTSSPSSFFSGARQLVVGSGSSDQGVTIYSGTAGNAQIFFADGTSGADAYRGIVRYIHSDNAMTFYTDGANERMRIDSSGNVNVGVPTADTSSNYISVTGGLAGSQLNAQMRFYGKSVSNTGATYETARISGGSTSPSYSLSGGLVFYTSENNGSNVLTLSERMRILSTGGITFNGDTAAANALDDYEEGTFDINLSDSNGGSNTINMAYVKIGRMVAVEGPFRGTEGNASGSYFVLSSTPDSNITLSCSLPFTPASSGAAIASSHRNLEITDGTSIGNGILPALAWNAGNASCVLTNTKTESSYHRAADGNTLRKADNRTNVTLEFNFVYFTSS
jgi:hypothetical protein